MPFWPITRSALVCLLSLTASSWPVDETHAGAAVDIRALPLLDQDGKPTSLHAFEDRAMVLHFIFTHCVAACHLQVRNLRAVREALAADTKRRVQFVSVSIDPEHDTPETLKRYAQSNGIDDANWRFVTASPEVVDQLTQSLAVKRRIVSDAQIDHTLAVFLFDARGRLIQRYADPVDGARLVREIGEVVRLFGIREPH